MARAMWVGKWRNGMGRTIATWIDTRRRRGVGPGKISGEDWWWR